jgi:hypothetical protein
MRQKNHKFSHYYFVAFVSACFLGLVVGYQNCGSGSKGGLSVGSTKKSSTNSVVTTTGGTSTTGSATTTPVPTATSYGTATPGSTAVITTHSPTYTPTPAVFCYYYSCNECLYNNNSKPQQNGYYWGLVMDAPSNLSYCKDKSRSKDLPPGSCFAMEENGANSVSCRMKPGTTNDDECWLNGGYDPAGCTDSNNLPNSCYNHKAPPGDGWVYRSRSERLNNCRG